MTAQTKTLLAGGAALAGARLYLKAPWTVSLVVSAAVMVGFLLLTDLPDQAA